MNDGQMPKGTWLQSYLITGKASHKLYFPTQQRENWESIPRLFSSKMNGKKTRKHTRKPLCNFKGVKKAKGVPFLAFQIGLQIDTLIKGFLLKDVGKVTWVVWLKIILGSMQNIIQKFYCKFFIWKIDS